MTPRPPRITAQQRLREGPKGVGRLEQLGLVFSLRLDAVVLDPYSELSRGGREAQQAFSDESGAT